MRFLHHIRCCNKTCKAFLRVVSLNASINTLAHALGWRTVDLHFANKHAEWCCSFGCGLEVSDD